MMWRTAGRRGLRRGARLWSDALFVMMSVVPERASGHAWDRRSALRDVHAHTGTQAKHFSFYFLTFSFSSARAISKFSFYSWRILGSSSSSGKVFRCLKAQFSVEPPRGAPCLEGHGRAWEWVNGWPERGKGVGGVWEGGGVRMSWKEIVA